MIIYSIIWETQHSDDHCERWMEWKLWCLRSVVDDLSYIFSNLTLTHCDSFKLRNLRQNIVMKTVCLILKYKTCTKGTKKEFLYWYARHVLILLLNIYMTIDKTHISIKTICFCTIFVCTDKMTNFDFSYPAMVILLSISKYQYQIFIIQE